MVPDPAVYAAALQESGDELLVADMASAPKEARVGGKKASRESPQT
jgi:hypothetical protein